MNVWQVAAGFDQRDYSDEFLRFGLAFVGGARQIETLKQVPEGDLLVLKRGISAVIAVGKVVVRDGHFYGKGDKHWLRDFDGWDLEAYTHVDWRTPTIEVPSEGLTIGTIKRVHSANLRMAAIAAYESGVPVPPPKSDPGPTKEVSDDHILEFLIAEGLRPAAAEELTSAFRRIRLLARYYRDKCNPNDVREHETRTFLVTPLLLALGWAEQQIKIELNVPGGRIDMACFSKPYRRSNRTANNEDCLMLVETKGLSQGLMYAHDQAKTYASQFPSCQAIVVTNGFCYKVFRRAAGQFASAPDAYLNLLDPRNRYPLDPDHVGGCLEVLRFLLPNSWRSNSLESHFHE